MNFKFNLEKRNFKITGEAEAELRKTVKHMVDNKGLHFGNAREVVNLLNEAMELQGNRIASDISVFDTNPDALTIIEAEDIPKK